MHLKDALHGLARHLLPCVLSSMACVVGAGAVAAAPRIGIFYDAAGTITSRVIEPNTPVTFYVVAFPEDLGGLKGAEFRVEGIPAGWSMQFNMIPNGFSVGDPLTGGVRIYPDDCQTSPVLLCTLTGTATTLPPATTVVRVLQATTPSNPAFQCPLAYDCNSLGEVCGTGADATIIPLNANAPVVCDQAVASEPSLWPPDHSYHEISILGVTDPDADPVTIVVTGITQDEPLRARGEGNTCPDGRIVNGQASVRAERAGTPGIPGNGRVYVIHFTASDGKGGDCTGSVNVRVPHDQGDLSCIDDGQAYNSLGSCVVGAAARQEVTEVALTVGEVTPTRATLEFALREDTQVEVTVFDVAGRRLATLEQGLLAAGVHQREWDMSGARKGLYFVRLRAGAATLTRTVVKTR